MTGEAATMRGAAERSAIAMSEEHATLIPLTDQVRALKREKESMERFAAAAAHELMEPLVMAEAYAMLLADELGDRLSDEARADLDNLLRGASRMRLIVETLLHDARCAGKPLERQPVDLAQVVRDAVELLTREVQAHNAHVETGPMPLVHGDPVLLGGVLKNLLLNALRYGPREGGRVEIRARRSPGGWRIAVSSEGTTIQPEDRERIFDPFCRGAQERRSLGTGLGLAICRSIVERHDGTIGVDPLHPRGNRFFFTIPDPSPAINRRPGLAVASSARSPHGAS